MVPLSMTTQQHVAPQVSSTPPTWSTVWLSTCFNRVGPWWGAWISQQGQIAIKCSRCLLWISELSVHEALRPAPICSPIQSNPLLVQIYSFAHSFVQQRAAEHQACTRHWSQNREIFWYSPNLTAFTPLWGRLTTNTNTWYNFRLWLLLLRNTKRRKQGESEGVERAMEASLR